MQAPAPAQPFENGTFDAVCCQHTTLHVNDVAAWMNELRREAGQREDLGG